MKKIIVFLLIFGIFSTFCGCTVEKPRLVLSPGTTEGGRYENSSVGISLEADSDWSLTGEAGRMAMMGANSGTAIEDVESYLDMYALRSDGTASAAVYIKYVGNMYGELMDVDEYIDLCCADLEADMLAAGYTDVSWEKNSPIFLGEEHSGVYYVGTYQLDGKEYPYYTQNVYLKQGDYVITVTVHSLLDDETEVLLSYFR